jgi:branched-chain amino acid transport system substrate-binding protein
VAADVLIQHIAKKEGGYDKLRGKKIALVYHDSPFGKEPMPAAAGARRDARLPAEPAARDAPGRGTEGHLAADPPAPSGLCSCRLGLGRDELATALKEAQATGYPREKMLAPGGPVPSLTSRTWLKAPRATTPS